MTVDRELIQGALPGYELGDELGRGACGVVITARHKRLDRKVAIKELPRAFAADEEVRARFVAEAQLLASFDHPHIVPIYDFVEEGGVCLLVMEFMPGGNVWTRFSAEGFRFESSVAVALATALALEYAHERGILHRDIKPDNLLFSRSGAVKVSDFGLAKVMGGAATMMTRTGQILGTPAYIAPEQALAEPITPATDVYSLGVMLFELLSGDLPFLDDGNPVTLLLRHVNDEPRQLEEFAPDVPEVLSTVVMRAIEKAPEHRYQSAWAFASDLAQAAEKLWGPAWTDRTGVPIELPDRLANRSTLRASAEAPGSPVRSSSMNEPRRSKRLVTGASGASGGQQSPNSPAPVEDLGIADVIPIDAFLDVSGVRSRPDSRLSSTPDAEGPAVGFHPDVSRCTGSPADHVSAHDDEPGARAVLPPPGWFPDPWGLSVWRWWDGERWSAFTG